MVDISDFLKKERFKGWSDLDFCSWMIKEVGVAAVPGSSFFKDGNQNYIRLHFARSEDAMCRWEVVSNSKEECERLNGEVRKITDRYVEEGYAFY